MWQEKNNYLVKEFDFDDFTQALEFVGKVDLIAAKRNHHPSIQLEWERVIIMLTTHEKGGITEEDHKLAEAIDAIPSVPR